MRTSLGLGLILTVWLQIGCAPSSRAENVAARTPSEGATPAPTAVKPLDTCFAPYEACDQKIIEFISGAQKTLDIAIYAITHPKIAEAIQQQFKRGIRVRMVVDRIQAAGNSSLVDELVAAGIPLKIGDTGRAIMHNKFTIVDGVALETGSYNYTKNASFENSENQIYIHELNIIKRYQTDFDSLWKKGLQPQPAQQQQ